MKSLKIIITKLNKKIQFLIVFYMKMYEKYQFKILSWIFRTKINLNEQRYDIIFGSSFPFPLVDGATCTFFFLSPLGSFISIEMSGGSEIIVSRNCGFEAPPSG